MSVSLKRHPVKTECIVDEYFSEKNGGIKNKEETLQEKARCFESDGTKMEQINISLSAAHYNESF